MQGKRILLIVTSASDVFIHNMAKWLKKSMDCTLDAFELYPSSSANQESESSCFNIIETANWNSWWGQNRITRFICSPVIIARQLDRFVNDKQYDVIHVHGLWFYVPLTRELKKHTEKLFVTFWGSEYKNGKVWMSHSLFEKRACDFIYSVNGIVGAKARLKELSILFPNIKMYQANLGAASMETIVSLTQTRTKEESKQYWNIPVNKITVLIGYSGKKLHNHLEIISSFNSHPELVDYVHFLAPMTRGAESNYIYDVENALKSSPFSYTLLKDRFLTDEDIAQLRYATDIVFQFATTDAYSRSIIESICAGAILIYGDWIKYRELLADDHFEAFAVNSIEKGIEMLHDYISFKDKYKKISNQNIDYGGKKYLWSKCINDWVDIYNGVKNAEVF